MKMTKEDYMHLPKERLAEMLVEKDNQPRISPAIHNNWWCSLSGRMCTNPFHDCFNCPNQSYTITCTTNGKYTEDTL